MERNMGLLCQVLSRFITLYFEIESGQVMTETVLRNLRPRRSDGSLGGFADFVRKKLKGFDVSVTADDMQGTAHGLACHLARQQAFDVLFERGDYARKIHIAPRDMDGRLLPRPARSLPLGALRQG
jgi:hypothetical protein